MADSTNENIFYYTIGTQNGPDWLGPLNVADSNLTTSAKRTVPASAGKETTKWVKAIDLEDLQTAVGYDSTALEQFSIIKVEVGVSHREGFVGNAFPHMIPIINGADGTDYVVTRSTTQITEYFDITNDKASWTWHDIQNKLDIKAYGENNSGSNSDIFIYELFIRVTSQAFLEIGSDFSSSNVDDYVNEVIDYTNITVDSTGDVSWVDLSNVTADTTSVVFASVTLDKDQISDTIIGNTHENTKSWPPSLAPVKVFIGATFDSPGSAGFTLDLTPIFDGTTGITYSGVFSSDNTSLINIFPESPNLLSAFVDITDDFNSLLTDGQWSWSNVDNIDVKLKVSNLGGFTETIKLNRVHLLPTNARYGIVAFDSTGNIVLDVTDRLTRFIQADFVDGTATASITAVDAVEGLGTPRVMAFSYALEADKAPHTVSITSNGPDDVVYDPDPTSATTNGETIEESDSLVILIGW